MEVTLTAPPGHRERDFVSDSVEVEIVFESNSTEVVLPAHLYNTTFNNN